MNELNLKAFIIIQQDTIDRYKNMAKEDSAYDYTEEISQHQDIIDALEKQIIHPVQIMNIKSKDKKYGVCPICKRGVVGEESAYCKFCGQKLKWD